MEKERAPFLPNVIVPVVKVFSVILAHCYIFGFIANGIFDSKQISCAPSPEPLVLIMIVTDKKEISCSYCCYERFPVFCSPVYLGLKYTQGTGHSEGSAGQERCGR